MQDHYSGIQSNPLISKIFQDITTNKELSSLEDVCESCLAGIGIDVSFFPMEYDNLYPAVVRSDSGKYSVGISQEKIYKNRCCAAAVVIICMEYEAPGFLKSYIKCHKIIDENPYYQEILHMQLIFFDLKYLRKIS